MTDQKFFCGLIDCSSAQFQNNSTKASDLFAVLLCLGLTCGPVYAEAPQTAFGFTFGQQFNAPPCEGSESVPFHPQEGYCFVPNNQTGYRNDSAYTGLVSTLYKYNDLPFWTGSKLSIYLVNGKIEGIISSTGGRTTDLSVTEDLINKYGKPTKQVAGTVQNGLGAKFDNTTLSWDLPNIKVQYIPIFSELKSGRVYIFSHTGLDVFQRSQQESVKPARGL